VPVFLTTAELPAVNPEPIIYIEVALMPIPSVVADVNVLAAPLLKTLQEVCNTVTVGVVRFVTLYGNDPYSSVAV
jgi:hypothetical protein